MSYSPFIALDEESVVPLYQQIYEIIRRSILSGEFSSGKQLLASRALAKQLSVSRVTVNSAYDQLLAEGYLESRIGAGTFVAAHLPEEFINTPRVKNQKNWTEIPKRDLKFSNYGKNIFRESLTILRNNQATTAVAFQHGLAAIDEFPFNIWTKLVNKIYQTLPRDDFGYGDAAGFYPLRKAIAIYLKSARAVNCSPEQIIITTGAQHAFDLIGRVLLERGEKVLIENPCYTGARQVFESFEAELIPVPVDENGLNLAALKEKQKARIVAVTPSHQFPLGVTMSVARRLQILEWAKRNEGWIVEDDYDSEFRYEDHPLASLQGLDRDGRVLYIGTFNKMIFPALRLGCLVVPPDLAETLTAARALSGSRASTIEQATLAEFINEGHLTRHIRRMRNLYQRRQEILIAEVEKHLAGRLEVKKSVSGMHVIGWLPKGADDQEISEKAATLGLKVSAVSAYSLTKIERGGLILGYTAVDEAQIKKGVRQLAKIL